MDERKVKIGGMEKVEVAEARMKEFVSSKVEMLEDWRAEVDHSRDIDEMLKLETTQLKKMKLKEEQKLKEAVGGEVNEVD